MGRYRSASMRQYNTSLYSAGWVKVCVHTGITIVIILRFFRLCDI